MNGIPKDAREVYCNEDGKPIAYCPREGLAITDIQRGEFFRPNEERLRQLANRVRQKDLETGVRHAVVCINVDDPTWTSLVEALMPNTDWNAFRARGEVPVARGVVPREPIERIVREVYPAALPFHDQDGVVNLVVFDAGGVSVFEDRLT